MQTTTPYPEAIDQTLPSFDTALARSLTELTELDELTELAELTELTELTFPPQSSGTSMRLLHTRVDVVSGVDVLAQLADTPHGEPRHLCYVNAHSLNIAYRDDSYQRVLSRADLVLNDGAGVSLAARMRGRRFPENLNGSDFTIRLLTLAAENSWRVYLYGGQPGVAQDAATALCARIDGLTIAGVCDGYTDRTDAEVAEDIRQSRADLVIVALGQPLQELWLDEHLPHTGCRLGVGVGAFLDFASGRVARAPRWMNRLGIEWLFRLAHEPGRLWQRYVVGNPVFLWRAWRLRTVEID
jgi:exopolysaccharide biosynthesis WecB/TagA/CpsF family protein